MREPNKGGLTIILYGINWYRIILIELVTSANQLG